MPDAFPEDLEDDEIGPADTLMKEKQKKGIYGCGKAGIIVRNRTTAV